MQLRAIYFDIGIYRDKYVLVWIVTGCGFLLIPSIYHYLSY